MNRKGKRISREDATDARARWAGRDDFGLRGRLGQWLAGPEAKWAGGARGQVGRGVGRAENQEKNEISELKLDF
jgi:hypothetical protein